MILQTIFRKPLLATAFGNRNVTKVDVREIRFAPGQQTGRHFHPCSVFGYIAEGAAVLQVEGEDSQLLPAGSAFHEPAGKTIARFDNASSSDPLTFIAFYLLDGDQELIEMLENE
jgi:quercetin dioxygenase-like cupin family protein